SSSPPATIGTTQSSVYSRVPSGVSPASHVRDEEVAAAMPRMMATRPHAGNASPGETGGLARNNAPPAMRPVSVAWNAARAAVYAPLRPPRMRMAATIPNTARPTGAAGSRNESTDGVRTARPDGPSAPPPRSSSTDGSGPDDQPRPTVSKRGGSVA